MAGAVVTHYEVYALDAQRWVLHARFHGSEKDEAVEEAKRVERTVGIAAKVTREVYHPGNNTAEEQVVYISDKSLRDASARKTLAPARPGPGGGLRGGVAMPGDGLAVGTAGSAVISPTVKRTKTAESMGLVLKLTIVISVALVIAGTVTGVVSAVLEKYPEYSVQMSDSAISLLMFSSFVMSFLITAVPLAMTLINWQGVGGRSKRREPERSLLRPAPVKPRKIAAPSPPPVEDVAPLFPDDAELVIADDSLPPDFSAEDPLESGFEAIPDLPVAEELSPEDVLPKEPVKDAATLHAEMLEAMKAQAMQFLSGLLSTIRAKRPQLDAYNKFGLDLMLAGGVELLAAMRHLDGGEKRKLLASVIESMGTKAETAKAFTEKVEDYLVEPRYVAMIQAGRSVMENFLAGSDSSDQLVGIALESWNKPQGQQAAPKIITVMFTDMVGSTDMTQAQGDEAAQTVVRRHNTIVRAALAQFAGKEVKHTGDGIMASFVSAANGVEAAASIQKAVASHNAKHPDQPLHLRIGMNAGEPIEEEDDLFGTTVQLAARVCAKADADQVFCTNVVRELSSGKKIDFAGLGAHSLKGFRDPIELYEVSWKPKKKG
jgi:class 3 adenylate cyclase